MAGVPMKGGRETVLSWPVILVVCAGKEGQKNREVSQGGNGSNSNTLFTPKLQVAHFHMPQIQPPPDCPSQLLCICLHKLNVALLTPVAGSLTATQPLWYHIPPHFCVCAQVRMSEGDVYSQLSP